MPLIGEDARKWMGNVDNPNNAILNDEFWADKFESVKPPVQGMGAGLVTDSEARAAEAAAIYLAPAVVLALLVVLVPLAFVIQTSVWSKEAGLNLEAFRQLWESPVFRRSLATTFEISAYGCRVQPAAGLSRRDAPESPAAAPATAYLHDPDAAVLDQHPGQELRVHRRPGQPGIINSTLVGWLWRRAQVQFADAVQPRRRDHRHDELPRCPSWCFRSSASLLAQTTACIASAEIMGARPLTYFWKSRCRSACPASCRRADQHLRCRWACTS